MEIIRGFLLIFGLFLTFTGLELPVRVEYSMCCKGLRMRRCIYILAILEGYNVMMTPCPSSRHGFM